MLSSGDIVAIDLGIPTGREAGFRRPAIVVTAQRILDSAPAVVHVVPLASTVRGFASEVELEPDSSTGLTGPSAAQCQQVRALSSSRVDQVVGNVGEAVLAQIRDVLGLILDIPG